MTGSFDPHEPTPEFRAHLAWQVESALRRQSRLAAPVSRSQTLRLVALVVVALAVGGAAGVASGHVQDARQRSSLTQNVMGELQLVQTRLELARAEYQDARRRFEIGLAGRESLVAAEQHVRGLEAALARLQLDLEEIKATSAAPRNELSAPRVAQRDFVHARLLLELQQSQQALAAAEERAAEARARVQMGTASPAVVAQAEARRAQTEAAMKLLQAKVQLRKRFLDDALKAEEVSAELRRTELTVNNQLAQRELAAAQERLRQLRNQASIGLAAELEVKRAEVELLERQLALQRLQRELEALRGGR